MSEPVSEEWKAEHTIAPEPKQLEESDQGCESATPSIAVGVEGMEACQYLMDSMDTCKEINTLYPLIVPESVSSSSVLVNPPSLPLPPEIFRYFQCSGLQGILFGSPVSSSVLSQSVHPVVLVPYCVTSTSSQWRGSTLDLL